MRDPLHAVSLLSLALWKTRCLYSCLAYQRDSRLETWSILQELPLFLMGEAESGSRYKRETKGSFCWSAGWCYSVLRPSRREGPRAWEEEATKSAVDSPYAKKMVWGIVQHSGFLKCVFVRGVFLFSNEKLEDGWYLFLSKNTALPGTDRE